MKRTATLPDALKLGLTESEWRAILDILAETLQVLEKTNLSPDIREAVLHRTGNL